MGKRVTMDIVKNVIKISGASKLSANEIANIVGVSSTPCKYIKRAAKAIRCQDVGEIEFLINDKRSSRVTKMTAEALGYDLPEAAKPAPAPELDAENDTIFARYEMSKTSDTTDKQLREMYTAINCMVQAQQQTNKHLTAMTNAIMASYRVINEINTTLKSMTKSDDMEV